MYEDKFWLKQQKPVKCPVCNQTLGSKADDEMFIGHCDECKATFTWYPGTEKPHAELDKLPSNKCDCPRCRSRK
jgi:hypothetical protein